MTNGNLNVQVGRIVLATQPTHMYQYLIIHVTRPQFCTPDCPGGAYLGVFAIRAKTFVDDDAEVAKIMGATSSFIAALHSGSGPRNFPDIFRSLKMLPFYNCDSLRMKGRFPMSLKYLHFE